MNAVVTHELHSDNISSARVIQLRGMFDLSEGHGSNTVVRHEALDIDDQPWSIGLIVGPSGSGKSTVAQSAFRVCVPPEPSDKAIVDLFPNEMSTTDVTALLSSVGFSSPPAWLRPLHHVSNGERFRVETALALAEAARDAPVCVDEFTSVVDRTVARIGSHAVAKHVRRSGQQFVAVSCHYDIIDWLQPDWTLDMLDGTFSWRSVQPRPRVEFTVERASRAWWRAFAHHHYLSADLPSSSRSWVGFVDGAPAAFLADMRQPHPVAKNVRRCTRIVVSPSYQGLGLGRIMLDVIGSAYRAERERFTITTTHPSMIAALNRADTWRMTTKPAHHSSHLGQRKRGILTQRRVTAAFEYAGPADTDAHDHLLPD